MLVRKIDRNHWPDSDTDASDIRADAITQSLRTSQDAMSVYEINTLDDINEAFLAIASSFKYPETFDVVTMENKALTDTGIDCIKTTGHTPVESLKETHNDIINLCYSKLGIIAKYVSERINDGHVYRCVRGDLKAILNKAIQEELLDPSTLSDELKEALQ